MGFGVVATENLSTFPGKLTLETIKQAADEAPVKKHTHSCFKNNFFSVPCQLAQGVEVATDKLVDYSANRLKGSKLVSNLYSENFIAGGLRRLRGFDFVLKNILSSSLAGLINHQFVQKKIRI